MWNMIGNFWDIGYFGNISGGTSGTLGTSGTGIKKGYPIGIPFNILLTSKDYLAITESALISATVESVADTAVLSNTTAVESVVASFVPLPPHATNVVAIAKIAITFFICLFFIV
jgi:hypothetical protein